jgi:hypothetical protein
MSLGSFVGAINPIQALSAVTTFGSDIWSAGRMSDEASFQRDWEKQMFGQRHQMEVADLLKAGLNPVLSAGGSPGTPSGATGDVPTGIRDPVSTAFQLKALQAGIAKTKQDTAVGKQTEALQNAQQNKADADTQFVLQSAMNAKTQGELLRAQLPSAEAEARFWSGLDQAGGTAKGLKEFVPVLKMLFGK